MLDKDILTDFQAEARGLLTELNDVVEKLEETEGPFPGELLEQFAQRIDRIMGAAQTMEMMDPGNPGLVRIGAIAQVCKRLGYKASEYKLSTLVPIFAAFWADTLEVLEQMIEHVGDEAKIKEITGSFGAALQKRLLWLSEKVQQLAPASAQQAMLSQAEIEKLVGNLR